MRLLTILTTAFLLMPAAHAGEWVSFPPGFEWCVSTAAHQIEGGNVNSDWWQWEQTPGHIRNGQKSGAAVDHWNRVGEDIGLIQDLGANAYRFSVEWAKIEPTEGVIDATAVQHYHDEVALLRERGISPIITLQHFTLPQWVVGKGAWEWDGMPEAFARYTALVYSQIAQGTRDWVTINEPMVAVMNGYQQGIFPPGEKRPMSGLVPVLRGLLRSHARAYHVLHESAAARGSLIRVGMAHHLRTFDPANRFNPLDLLATHLVAQAWNWMIPDALETGHLHFNLLWLVHANELIDGLSGTQDFVGVNYYTGDLIELSLTHGIIQKERKNLPKSDLGWTINPPGFYRVLKTVAKKYPALPILITENGVADSNDGLRPEFIRAHLAELSRAIRDGARVEGYCHWSLMDNFEWAEGFAPRFGLYAVDYSTLARSPRPSAALFHDIAVSNGFWKN